MKVGILGAGQLGQMLALAGYSLGIAFLFYDSDAEACAGRVGELVLGEFNDKEQLRKFAEKVDVITLERECIPLEALNFVSKFAPVYPSLSAIEIAQDRLLEKRYFKQLGIPTPEFFALDGVNELAKVAATSKEKLVIKSRRNGYDGKGQVVLDSTTDTNSVLGFLGREELIAEQFVQFEREISIIGVRSVSGKTLFYPLVENIHRNGILRQSKVRLNDCMQSQAEKYATLVMENLNYTGVMTFEYFEHEEKLLANEFAPRVHNSGHWTIEGAKTSQFENHLRAILGWPLGDPAARYACVMHNIIEKMPDVSGLLALSDVHVHNYAKSPKPGRKLGHITICECAEYNKVNEIMSGI